MSIKEIKNKMLTEEQCDVVKEMIVDSMKSVYIDMGDMPSPNFYPVAGKVADGILKNVQKALLQSEVFAKAVKDSKPLKTKKTK